jgi:phage baseplate assembly protein W
LIKIKDRVATAIEEFEPRVQVEDVIVREDVEGNGVNITVSFLVIGTTEPITITTFLQRVR